MELKQKAEMALSLRNRYASAYQAGDIAEGKKLEHEYLTLRLEVLNEVNTEIKRQRSIPVRLIKQEVANMPKRPKRETGIRSLDYALVTERQAMLNHRGGFSLGNYIQIAGSRGAGKSSLMLKIMTSLSNHERVSWFDFEMGKKRVTEKLEDFEHNEDNLLYYNSSRDLDDVVSEIKLLNASGVNHFVIDSTMKLNIKGVSDRYERYSLISQNLSELTSTLGINIYIINQISQSSERDGVLAIKHGNDAEYDADYIIYILKMKLVENGKVKKDEFGMDLFNEDMRIIKCTKNREDDRLFTIELNKSEIFGIEPEVYEYEETA
ncbi:hypothetical protein PF327_10880 [Sulfurovum sp. XTW-4]|uniref:Uncharacterized protein n=1 Tax=Sulfurovum xiamenensis TaxID=3019066 RepID=A0ABT7QUF9_9BACT|nr:hypothetical protein [Sulfurovum xiamenensis]MDM5264699.1 hypothetical protein [Sulfurovum xiamenensis]